MCMQLMGKRDQLAWHVMLESSFFLAFSVLHVVCYLHMLQGSELAVSVGQTCEQTCNCYITV